MPLPRILPALLLSGAAALAGTAFAQPPEPSQKRIDSWWTHVETIASDANEGRLAGSPGFDRAADYVVAQLKKAGLKPAGVDGWFQPVELVEQKFDPATSSAAVKMPSGEMALNVPQDLYFRGSFPMPEQEIGRAHV